MDANVVNLKYLFYILDPVRVKRKKKRDLTKVNQSVGFWGPKVN